MPCLERNSRSANYISHNNNNNNNNNNNRRFTRYLACPHFGGHHLYSQKNFLWDGVISPMPNYQLEYQDSVLISPSDRVTMLYHRVPVLILVSFYDTNGLRWSSHSRSHHMRLPRLTARTESINSPYPDCSVCVVLRLLLLLLFVI
jgi:hypothetical protein